LDTTALTIAGHAIPGYKVIQYGSTAVGLPLLAALAVLWLSRQPSARLESLPKVPRAARLAVILTMVVILAVLTRPVWGDGSGPMYDRVGRSIQESGLSLMIALLAYCLACCAFTGWRSGSMGTPPSEGGR
jgi:hypothetical protein